MTADMRLLACYGPAIVVAAGALLAAGTESWSRVIFLAVFAFSIVAHIRWGRS